jgi:formate dehydrogenase
MQTVYTTCRYCESNCALAVEVESNRVTRIRADKNNPQTWQDACSKGLTSREMVEHPQRITAPMKRVGGRYVEVEYEQALREIAAQLSELVDQHGPDALGYYYGNPAGFSSAITLSMGFMQGLGSSNLYSASSIDQNNNHVVSQAVFGHVFVPFSADVDHADFILMVGMNPAESKFNWLGNTSDGWNRARQAMARGAHVAVVDPRKTLTARQASEHIAIVPGQDWAFLLAMLQVIVREDAFRDSAVYQLPGDQWQQLRALALAVKLDELATRCGVARSTIERLALAFANARRGMCLTQTGVSMHETGTIAHWLGLVLDIVTGHLDQPGGRRWDAGYVNMTEFARQNMPPESRSRVRGLSTVMGYRALAELPDEINTPGPGQCRALIMHCGNPVVSGPNGAALDSALEKLDLLIAVDLVQRESHRHADWLIPGLHWLERGELVYNLAGGMDQPHVQYSNQALEPPPGVVPEWQFFTDLALAMGVPMLGRPGFNSAIKLSRWLAGVCNKPAWAFSARTLEWLMVKMGKTVSWKAVQNAPHGLNYSDKRYGQLAEQLGKLSIRIAPAPFLSELQRLLAQPLQQDQQYPLRLIGKRTLNMMNSWHMDLPNARKRKETLRCELHPKDALALTVEEGDRVLVESKVGSIELEVELSPLVTPGCVCVQHGWGSRVFDPAADGEVAWVAGVNRNLLVDHRVTDPFSGTPAFNSTAVRVVKL